VRPGAKKQDRVSQKKSLRKFRQSIMIASDKIGKIQRKQDGSGENKKKGHG